VFAQLGQLGLAGRICRKAVGPTKNGFRLTKTMDFIYKLGSLDEFIIDFSMFIPEILESIRVFVVSHVFCTKNFHLKLGGTSTNPSSRQHCPRSKDQSPRLSRPEYF
jgi:hypothetical protein